MIKAGYDFISTNSAHLKVEKLNVQGSHALLVIDSWWFDAQSVKELRKFLKKLQRQLEQAELDTLD